GHFRLLIDSNRAWWPTLYVGLAGSALQRLRQRTQEHVHRVDLGILRDELERGGAHRLDIGSERCRKHGTLVAKTDERGPRRLGAFAVMRRLTDAWPRRLERAAPRGGIRQLREHRSHPAFVTTEHARECGDPVARVPPLVLEVHDHHRAPLVDRPITARIGL